VGYSVKYITKKHTIAVAIDINMARVRVAPMKIPSQVNAANPHNGIAIAQGK
jgi:hypothetical protein